MALVGTLLVNLKARTAEFDKNMRRSSERVRGFRRGVGSTSETLKRFGKTMVAAVGFYAVARGLRASIKAATDFRKQMAMVSTMLSGEGMAYLDSYSKGIRRLSVAMGETTATLSKGLYDILSASISASKAMDVLTISAKAAIGGMTDTATAADLLTTTLNAYGIAAERTEEVADMLFATVAGGKLTFGELSASFGRVAAMASGAGLSLQEALGSIALMTRAGIKSTEAMTGLKSILGALLSPAEQAAEIFEDMHIEIGKAALESRGLTGLMEDLKRVAPETLAKLFPKEALVGVMAMVRNTRALQEDIRSVTESAGAAQEAFNKMADTRIWERLAAVLEEIKRIIGRELEPTAAAFTEGLIDDLQKIRDSVNFLIAAWNSLGMVVTSVLRGIIVVAIGWNARLVLLIDEHNKRAAGIVGFIEGLRKAMSAYGDAAAAAWDRIGKSATRAKKSIEDAVESLPAGGYGAAMLAIPIRTLPPGEVNVFASLKEDMEEAAKTAEDILAPAFQDLQDQMGAVTGRTTDMETAWRNFSDPVLDALFDIGMSWDELYEKMEPLRKAFEEVWEAKKLEAMENQIKRIKESLKTPLEQWKTYRENLEKINELLKEQGKEFLTAEEMAAALRKEWEALGLGEEKKRRREGEFMEIRRGIDIRGLMGREAKPELEKLDEQTALLERIEDNTREGGGLV